MTQARSRLIEQSKLVSKISQKNKLTEQDYDLISTILCALSSKKERINYFFIFGLSAAALILAVYFDLIRWGTAEIVLHNQPVLGFTYESSGSLIVYNTGSIRQFNAQRDYLWPIPFDEITLLPKLTQNPGY